MIIKLKKFGKVLTSYSDGKKAFAAIRPILDPNAEMVEINFSDIISLGPSCADEFFIALENIYKGRIKYLPTDNQSAIETLAFLEKE